MKILIIEDNDATRQQLKKALEKPEKPGLPPKHTCNLLSCGEMIKNIDNINEFDLAIIDQDLGEYNWTGIETGRRLKQKVAEAGSTIKLVMLTALANDTQLKDLALSGVFDGFLAKPLHIPDLKVYLDHAESDAPFEQEIIGSSPKLMEVLKLARIYANTPISVFIHGEPGTGKEGLAKSIHEHSSRNGGSYVSFNCAVGNDGTIESELFGHVKGAFTGANQNRVGYFEKADKGTIFLDEIGDMPLSVQAKLLRTLECGELQKIGASVPIRVNVRVIAASNKNLEDMIENGTFRQDLYDRISVLKLELPPLRERVEDIMSLALHFVEKIKLQNNDTRTVSFDNGSQKILEGMVWRGNVRALKGSMELTYYQYPSEHKKIVITQDCLKTVPGEMNFTANTSGNKIEDAILIEDVQQGISNIRLPDMSKEFTLREIAGLLDNIQLRQELDGAKPGDMILLENAYINLVKKIIDKAQDRKGSMIQALSFLAGEDLGELSYLSTAIHKRIESKLRLFKGLKTPESGRIPRGRTGNKKTGAKK